MKRRLTGKQELFAQRVASGMNQTQAYMEVYSTKNMMYQTCKNEASVLARRDDIIARVDEIREPVVREMQLTLKEHLDDLKKLRDMAAENSQLSAAITAEIARGKAAGVSKEQIKHEVTAKPWTPISDEDFLG